MTPSTPRQRGRGLRWRSWSTALAAVLVCTLTQCVCQTSRRAEPAPHAPAPGAATAAAPQADAAAAEPAPALPAGLDVGDLDDAEKALLAEVLAEQFDPCGEPRSFAESLADPDTCAKAREMGPYAVELVRRGLSKRQVARGLLEELSRTAVKATFDVEGLPSLGDPAAKRVIVEFIDYQCPFCKLASKPVQELAKAHGATLVAKQLPLEGHHPFAREAALAALAAHQQGRYWAMSEALFARQAVLDSEQIVEAAKEVGLDMARFEADRKGAEVARLLARDIAEADRYALDGTPYFFLDGFAVEFDQLEEKLKQPPASP